MNEPIAKKATKKRFHFPKSADAPAVEVDDAEPTGTAHVKKVAATDKKASKRQTASVAEVSPPAAEIEARAKRAKKEKVVRDSFTMPKSDYEKIAALKQKCLAAGVSAKKSEILRAGLLLLDAAAPKRLLAAVTAVEPVKTGRPAKS
ncbi:hypothetical protein AAGS40_28515 (plasmid) [Paraburkholderia sp. PREW-6R]|uniref:hypothetical protein n=1 Tax=Paraburkholderia sp. PREW-6R TaxID=3141544 RepID=UPI0031F5AB75